MKHRKNLVAAGSIALMAGALLGGTSAHADTLWNSGSDFIDVTADAGYLADSAAFSGTVATHSQFVTVSGQFKINTTIVSITPQPGFTATVRKSGGLDSPVEVEFNSARCSAKYSLLIKPGLTKIDGGVMRCK